MRKLLTSLTIIGSVLAVAFGLSQAFFSDTETSQDNILQAGALDLKIDNESYYNGILNADTTWDLNDLTDQLFFNFTDIKPDDHGEDTISLHAENDYWACIDMTVTSNDDNTCTEPELLDDPTCTSPGLGQGELGGLVNFIWWADDGDNVLEDNETPFITVTDALTALNKKVALADATHNIWGTPGPLSPQNPYYIGKAWCFGTLGTAPRPQDGSGVLISPAGDNDGVNGAGRPEDGGYTCDGASLNNASQTDILKGDIKFTAYQARNNSGFNCDGTTISPTPTTIACEPGFATGVASSAQGTRKDGSAVTPDRTDPTKALGAPQSTGTPSDSPVVPNSFFSLGFGPSNVGGGNIVLSFTNPIVNLAGYDFRVFEVTGGTYPDEKIKVEASQDGTNFFLVSASASRDAFLDLTPSGLAWASYLRITDQSDKSLFESTADAYDLDGVQTFCGTQPI